MSDPSERFNKNFHMSIFFVVAVVVVVVVAVVDAMYTGHEQRNVYRVAAQQVARAMDTTKCASILSPYGGFDYNNDDVPHRLCK